MRVDGEQVGAFRVNAAQDEGGRHVALVPEQVVLQQGEGSDDAGVAVGGVAVQGEGGGDHACVGWGVGGG